MVNEPSSRNPAPDPCRPHFHVGPAWHGRAAQVKVLRAVASFELAKGLLVLAAGIGVLFFLHKDTGEMAENLLHLLHISPDHHFARIFLHWADSLTDSKLWAVCGVALVYSILRFIESYGLWNARVWAEWIALVSGLIYVPIEIREIMRRVNTLRVSILFINVAIVLYMMYLRWNDDRCREKVEGST